MTQRLDEVSLHHFEWFQLYSKLHLDLGRKSCIHAAYSILGRIVPAADNPADIFLIPSSVREYYWERGRIVDGLKSLLESGVRINRYPTVVEVVTYRFETNAEYLVRTLNIGLIE